MVDIRINANNETGVLGHRLTSFIFQFYVLDAFWIWWSERCFKLCTYLYVTIKWYSISGVCIVYKPIESMLQCNWIVCFYWTQVTFIDSSKFILFIMLYLLFHSYSFQFSLFINNKNTLCGHVDMHVFINIIFYTLYDGI